MKTTLIVLLMSALQCAAANFAVTFYQNHPNGIPDGWPATIRSLGDAVGPLSGAEQLKTGDELDQIRATLGPAKEAWNQRQELRRMTAPVMLESVRQRILANDFAELKLDAKQSEFMGILLQAFLNATEQLQLIGKAVAGTVATNNLNATERARFVTLRNALTFPQQAVISAEDKARAVDIRVNILEPHHKLFQAAQAVVEAWRTNAANAPDPRSPTNLPSVTIGD